MSASNVVGVDIGSEKIRAVEISGAGKAKPTVLRHHEVVLPEGAVVSGEVVEINTVAAALKQLWRAGKFRSKNVVLGVGNPKVLVRDLTVPKLAAKEIKESLPAHVQDLLPVPVDEALLDFYPIREEATEHGPVVHGLLVAAVKDAVLANVRAVQQAGLHPVGVDLIPFALTRLQGVEDAPGAIAYVDIGDRTTNVVVAVGGVVQFVRIIGTGGGDLTQALVDRLDVQHHEAWQLKSTLGLAPGQAVPADQVAAVQTIREVTTELLNSLRNTLAYFANTHGQLSYDGIVLSGGGANLPGFQEAMGEIMRIPVTSAQPFEKVSLSRELQKTGTGHPSSMTVALGLALGSAA